MMCVTFGCKKPEHGMITAMGAAAAAPGPLIGGGLIELAGWRSIFLINLPLGIAIIATMLIGVRPQPTIPGSRLDLAGAALAVGMLFALNYGLLAGASQTWRRGDVRCALLGVPVLLAGLLILEHRRGKFFFYFYHFCLYISF